MYLTETPKWSRAASSFMHGLDNYMLHDCWGGNRLRNFSEKNGLLLQGNFSRRVVKVNKKLIVPQRQIAVVTLAQGRYINSELCAHICLSELIASSITCTLTSWL